MASPIMTAIAKRCCTTTPWRVLMHKHALCSQEPKREPGAPKLRIRMAPATRAQLADLQTQHAEAAQVRPPYFVKHRCCSCILCKPSLSVLSNDTLMT